MRLAHTALFICSVLAAHAVSAQCLKPYPVYDEDKYDAYVKNTEAWLVCMQGEYIDGPKERGEIDAAGLAEAKRRHAKLVVDVKAEMAKTEKFLDDRRAKLEREAINIHVDFEGKYFLDGTLTDLETIRRRLLAETQRHPQQAVNIRIERLAPLEQKTQIISFGRSALLKYVYLNGSKLEPFPAVARSNPPSTTPSVRVPVFPPQPTQSYTPPVEPERPAYGSEQSSRRASTPAPEPIECKTMNDTCGRSGSSAQCQNLRQQYAKYCAIVTTLNDQWARANNDYNADNAASSQRSINQYVESERDRQTARSAPAPRASSSGRAGSYSGRQYANCISLDNGNSLASFIVNSCNFAVDVSFISSSGLGAGSRGRISVGSGGRASTNRTQSISGVVVCKQYDSMNSNTATCTP